jgi:hypothetical protein
VAGVRVVLAFSFSGVVAVNETPSGRSRTSTSRFISRQSIRPKRDVGCRPM